MATWKIRRLTNFNSIGKAFKDLVDQFHSAQSGLTAAVASDQAGGVALTGKWGHRFATVANAGDSATLPAALPGMTRYVKNAGANSMDVFPASGESINALSNDAAYAVAATKAVLFVCTLSGKWDTILTA